MPKNLVSASQDEYVRADGTFATSPGAATTTTAGVVLLDGNAADIAGVAASAAVGSTGKAADAGHAHTAPGLWLPSDNNLLLATHDPAMSSASGIIQNGRLYLGKLFNRTGAAVTISNLWFIQASGAAGSSTGTFCGLYSAAGTLLTGSADIGAQFTGNGQSPIGPLALTTPQAVAAGAYVWAALLANLTTAPTLFSGVQDGTLANVGWSTTGPTESGSPQNYRYAAILSAGTSLPASITLANLTYFNNCNWMGAS